jgi:uncharacterized membrane protein YgcG
MRFIQNMKYDKTCFSVALINLAVKGFLKITGDNSDEYVLQKLDGSDKHLAAGEKILLEKLFSNGSVLALEQSNNIEIKTAIDAHQSSLEKDYEKIYFKTNSGYFFLGLFISLAIFIASIIFQFEAPKRLGAIVGIIWLSGWSLIVFTMIKNTWKRGRSGMGYISAIREGGLFLFTFLFFECLGVFAAAELSSWSLLIAILSFSIINWLFYELLKAPTLAGRKLLDKVEGFKRYIEVAEKKDLEYKYSSGKTPELFEHILPYAMALGVEQQWGVQFEDVLLTASYSPSWYHGKVWDIRHISNSSSLLSNSLTSAVSFSSKAPGSSSGSSSGGGFSGGGGGGGGGGGW